MREHRYFVYLLASKRNGTLYLGVTNDVMRRTWQHKNDIVKGFTSRYGVHILVWFETYDDIGAAIAREKQIKGWNRAWKIKLIERHNSGWNDLYARLLGDIALPDMPGFPSLASPDGDARRERQSTAGRRGADLTSPLWGGRKI